MVLIAQESNQSLSSFDYSSSIEVKKKAKLNDSPYAIFGDNTTVLKTDHEQKKDHSLKIPIVENGIEQGVFELDFETGIASIFDMNRDLIVEQKLSQDQLGRFLTMDPLTEKKPWLSPYQYSRNNPLRFIDPDGRDEWDINEKGEIVNRISNNKIDAFHVVDAKGTRTGASLVYEIKDGNSIISQTKEKSKSGSYDKYVINEGKSTEIFEFLADNTVVEWSVTYFQKETKTVDIITTSHEEVAESGMGSVIKSMVQQGYGVKEDNHSHPNGYPYPSGLFETGGLNNGDIGVAKQVTRLSENNGVTPSFNIYMPKNNRLGNAKYAPYNKNMMHMPNVILGGL